MKHATPAVIAASILIILFEVAVVELSLKSMDDEYDYELSEAQLVLARSIARQLEAHVAGTHDKLTAMSNVREIKEGNTEQCNSKLDEMYFQFKLVPSSIARINKEYVRDCATIRSVIGSNVKNYEYVKTIFGDPLHRPVMGRALQSIVYEGRYFVPMVVPIFDADKNFVGTLGSAQYLDELKEKYFSAGLDNNIRAIIIDDDDTILYHPLKALIGKNMWSNEVSNFAGSSPAFVELRKAISTEQSGATIVKINGTDYIEAYAPANVFEGRRWTVVVTKQIGEKGSVLYVHKQSMRSMTYITVLLINAAFIFALTAYFYVRKKKL